MNPTEIDRNLLLGLLALQIGLVDRDRLVSAIQDWAMDEAQPLGDVLVERGGLTSVDFEMLTPVVERHIALHGGDPRKSLESLDSAWSAVLGVDPESNPGSGFERTMSYSGSTEQILGSLSDVKRPYSGQATATGGRFRVLRLLDRGGLGEVFVARDEEIYREVAVKQIRSDHDDQQNRARFLQEAKITGALEHPGIVPVYGLGHHDDGRPFYAMRFIRGSSLREAIAAFHEDSRLETDPGLRSLELRKLLGRFLDVCDAIAYAHSRGVLHRDLKPGNVMLGNFGETLVVDWGLAKSLKSSEQPERSGEGQASAELDSETDGTNEFASESDSGVNPTRMGDRMGTPAYMPPEQAGGRLNELGPRSDVYSLGATLFTLLTGKPPYHDGDVETVLDHVQKGDFTRPRKICPWIHPALEAICVKAMGRDPESRYPTPRALAEDLQKWMADEPVSVWREPFSLRFSRWAKRHRTLVTSSSVAAAIGLVTLGYALYQARILANQRLTAALGRVDALTTAEVRAIPLILDQIAPDRRLVNDRLKAIVSGSDDRRRMPASLALLPDDPGQTAFLSAFAVERETNPEEVLVIRESLATHAGRSAAAGLFRAELAGELRELTDGQLRAAGMLARLDPDDPVWPRLADPLALKLARENSMLIDKWREVFQPVSHNLLAPLQVIYADHARPEMRERAFALLFEFATQTDNPKRPEDLAALLPDADPVRLEQILSQLSDAASHSRAVQSLTPLITPLARFDEPRAARQGRVAAALLRLGEAAKVWPIFVHTDDPTARTELIHELPGFGINVLEIINRLRAEPDRSARRALLLCLGKFPPLSISDPERGPLLEELATQYRDDPDPGIHGTLGWLLRHRFGLAQRLTEIDRSLAATAVPPGRNWFINGQGQSFAIVKGPVDLRMGSTPEVDPTRQPDEVSHLRRIPRSFAIGMHEVTLAEFSRFLDTKPAAIPEVRDEPEFRQYIPSPDCAMGNLSWYDAARYCNWLSAREGIPESQWCYPKEIGPGCKLPTNYLERTGYRLPTEAEWEYSCRAGSMASRSFGCSVPRLVEYAWFGDNANSKMHPVGLKMPNDLGIFDMLGNAVEWCNDLYLPYPVTTDNRPVVDRSTETEVADKVFRAMRGGVFFFPSPMVRSAYRISERPYTRATVVGFRMARTLP